MFNNIILPKDFYKKVEEDGYLKHIHYGDSVAENTKTIIKKSSNNHIEEITFLDLWNYLESINLKKEFINEKEYIFINDEEIKSICFNSKNDSFEIKPIKYIMRHKIHKNIKKLIIENKYNTELLLTDDHSLVKFDKNNNLIKCKINETNNIIYKLSLNKIKICKITKIEDVFYDGYVYDLEINEIHNFIANGYIVHNTDSIFPTFPIENPDKLSIDELWNKVSEHAKNINNLIELYCNHTLFERCNIDPQHNHTSFKTEMVLDSLLLLDIKKVYAYKVLIEKGKIKNKIEYKGFPIIRSDYSQLTKDILREFIEKIIFNKDIKLEDKYDHIINVYNKYYSLFVDNINKSDFSYVGIPAKWAKKIQYINGMSLYNFLVNKNIFSYGSSGKFVYCIFKNKNLFKKITGIEDISKLNGICIPYKYDLEFLKNKFNEFDIEIDTKVHWDTIFNKTCFRTKNLIKRLSGKNLI